MPADDFLVHFMIRDEGNQNPLGTTKHLWSLLLITDDGRGLIEAQIGPQIAADDLAEAAIRFANAIATSWP